MTGCAPLRGKSRQNVVGLEVLFSECCDVHGVQGVLEKRNLANELGRCLTAGALVLGVLLGAEAVARDVERYGNVGGLLLCQQIEHHRDEAMNRVRVLSVCGLEAVHRKRVKRPKCQRMSINNEESRLCFGGHEPKPIARIAPRFCGVCYE